MDTNIYFNREYLYDTHNQRLLPGITHLLVRVILILIYHATSEKAKKTKTKEWTWSGTCGQIIGFNAPMLSHFQRARIMTDTLNNKMSLFIVKSLCTLFSFIIYN